MVKGMMCKYDTCYSIYKQIEENNKILYNLCSIAQIIQYFIKYTILYNLCNTAPYSYLSSIHQASKLHDNTLYTAMYSIPYPMGHSLRLINLTDLFTK